MNVITNNGRSKLAEAGMMVSFQHRVMEVVELEPNKLSLEYVDAGGIKWWFNPTGVYSIPTILEDTEDRVLDSMAAIASHQCNDPGMHETERRFADPRPGDSFHEMFSFWVIVDEVLEDGRINCRTSGGCDPDTGWIWKPVTYESAAVFRKAFAYGSIPGYSVRYSPPRVTNTLAAFDTVDRAAITKQ